MILIHQQLRFYKDGQDYKVNCDYDLFRLIHHNFPSFYNFNLMKIFLPITKVMLLFQRLVRRGFKEGPR